MLDRQSMQEEQITKLKQGHSDSRIVISKMTSDIDTIRIDIDNQSDVQTAFEKQVGDIKIFNSQISTSQYSLVTDLQTLSESCDSRFTSVRDDLAKTDEALRVVGDKLLIMEMERLPQIETSTRNMQVYIDIQRDAI